MKNLILILAASLLAGKAYAITVNPASSTIGDSSDSTETLIYRDTVGSFDTKTMRITGSSAGTTDLIQYRVSGSTVARVGPDGGLGIRRRTRAQVDTRVPDFISELIMVTDYSNALSAPGGFILCVSTGLLASQYAVMNSTHGINQNGCGTNQ